jgi:hypothetical protein
VLNIASVKGSFKSTRKKKRRKTIINVVVVGFDNIGREVFWLAKESGDFRVTGIATRNTA